MYALILLSFIQYPGTSISIAQVVMPERYTDAQACDQAGNSLSVKTSPDSPVKGINDIRVGYICIRAGTVKPIALQ